MAIAAPPPEFKVSIPLQHPTYIQPVLIVTPFCDTPDESIARARFADLFALNPVVDHTSVHPYPEQNKILNLIATHGDRKYMKGFAFRYMTVPFLEYVFNSMAAYLEMMGSEDAGSAIIFECFPTEKLSSVPSDGTAFSNRGMFFNCTLSMRWRDPAQDDTIRRWIKKLIAGVKEIETRTSNERGEVFVEGGYANHNLEEDKAAEAFKGNLPRLKEIKRKWDPKGRFNKWFPISVT
jgi:hypothetical protein